MTKEEFRETTNLICRTTVSYIPVNTPKIMFFHNKESANCRTLSSEIDFTVLEAMLACIFCGVKILASGDHRDIIKNHFDKEYPNRYTLPKLPPLDKLREFCEEYTDKISYLIIFVDLSKPCSVRAITNFNTNNFSDVIFAAINKMLHNAVPKIRSVEKNPLGLTT
jgi:hypothetical protein